MARLTFVPRHEYLGTGSVDAYSYGFKITALSQILIKVCDENFEEVFSVRGDDTTYLDSVTMSDTGGTVTLQDDLDAGYHLVILQADDSPKQTFRFRDAGSFTLAKLEQAFDYLSGQIQRLTYQSGRALSLSDYQLDADSVDMQLPVITETEAEHVPMINATADGWEYISREDLVGPQGDQGDQGDQGPSGTLTVGTVGTGAPGTDVEITNVGTAQAAILNIVIPKGDPGETSYVIFTEVTDPTGGDGNETDVWINTLTGDVFQKLSGTWDLRGNLQGPEGEGFPTGGATGQVLRKVSGTDFDTEWADFSPGQKGTTYIADGASALTITFPEAQPNDTYRPLITIENTVDSADVLAFLQYVVTEKTVDDMTVTFNMPAPTANYKVNWDVN